MNIPLCPFCGNDTSYIVKGGKQFQCKKCRKKHSIKSISFLKGSKLNNDVIYKAISILKNSDISSVKLAKELGITQKTSYSLKEKIIKEYNLGYKKIFQSKILKPNSTLDDYTPIIDKLYLLINDRKSKIKELTSEIEQVGTIIDQLRVSENIINENKRIKEDKEKFKEELERKKQITILIRLQDEFGNKFYLKNGDTLILNNNEYVYLHSVSSDRVMCRVYKEFPENSFIVPTVSVSKVLFNSKINIIKHNKPLMSTEINPIDKCKMCGNEIAPHRKTYCSQKCYNKYQNEQN